MARDTSPIVKQSRREGVALHPKAHKILARKSGIPGEHAHGRQGKQCMYATQLREKQKVRRMYGVLETQFLNYFTKADMAKGVTGANLLISLERRLDSVVYRLGFAHSRQQARQLVRHGIFTLNGHKANIPSQLVNVGDIVEVPEKKRKIAVIADAQGAIARRGCPAWLEADASAFRGVVKAMPQREDIQSPINEDLIVEYYSK